MSGRSPGRRLGSAVQAVAAVVVRPRLWGVALRQWRRTTPPRWWSRRPFLPVPTAAFLGMRQVVQHGRADHPVRREDVLNYLRWCQLQR